MNLIVGLQHQSAIDLPIGDHPASGATTAVGAIPLKRSAAGRTRASRPEVRNPILALRSVARFRALHPDVRHALQEILLDIQSDARLRAEKCWRSHKPPLAAYWAACGVYAGHIARSIGPLPGRRSSTRRAAQI